MVTVQLDEVQEAVVPLYVKEPVTVTFQTAVPVSV